MFLYFVILYRQNSWKLINYYSRAMVLNLWAAVPRKAQTAIKGTSKDN